MVKIPEVANKVPMMFRAQTAGRCQLQRIDPQKTRNKEKQDVEHWTSEWIEKTYPDAPQFSSKVQTRTYQISWRFVTNSGQDDGIIRPVIGAYGWPYYPGSSMKGIFRSACNVEQKAKYCGKDIGNSDWQPGILRFHGGYPTDLEWRENLVDIVHPQQFWQVGIPEDRKAGAFSLISLYQPELIFGISATQQLTQEEWQEIWEIWDKAMAKGLGCRVSAGYGQSQTSQIKALYSCQLKGQGMAAKLLDGEGEFRPNIFRAGIRGHALRIFGGLTSAKQAIELVETLFGGVQNHGTVGLLAMNFEKLSSKPRTFGQGAYQVSTYNVEGQLKWFLTQTLSESQKEALTKLIKALTRFAMTFGGFGKSWRRADHRLFFPEYNEDSRKPLIGCHWQWSGTRSLKNDIRVRSIDKITSFIDEVLRTAMDWMELQGITLTPNQYAQDWREAWHPDKVEVWGRLADEAEDSRAILWFHQAYRQRDRQFNIKEGSIYESHLTGKAGRDSEVGRIWHRMFPRVALLKDKTDPKKRIARKTPQYLELITFFPDGSEDSEMFLDFLYDEQKQFKKLWPI